MSSGRKVEKGSIWYDVETPMDIINENIKEEYIWNYDNPRPIIMTVGMPLFKSGKISWIALESLKNQKEIDFGWELIIYEEFGNTLDVIKSFVGKLPGCQRIFYRTLKNIEKLPLSTKWISIASHASKTSKIFAFQDADDYSPTMRLHIHKKHFENSGCFLSTQVKGIFYNIKSKKTMLYNGYNINKIINHTNLNHAILTKDFKEMIDDKQYRLMHSYLFRNIKRIHKKEIGKKFIWTNEEVHKNNWKSGFFTDRFNTISKSRKRFYNKPTHQFEVCKYKMKKYIPPNVLKYLYQL